MFSRSIALKSSSMVSAANVAPLFASVANSGHGFVVDPKSPSLFRAELKKGEPTWAVAAVLMVGAGFWIAGFVNRSSDEPSNERGINYYMAKFAINSHCY